MKRLLQGQTLVPLGLRRRSSPTADTAAATTTGTAGSAVAEAAAAATDEPINSATIDEAAKDEEADGSAPDPAPDPAPDLEGAITVTLERPDPSASLGLQLLFSPTNDFPSVSSIVPRGLAEAGGLSIYDLVLSVNGVDIRDTAAAEKVFKSDASEITFIIKRPLADKSYEQLWLEGHSANDAGDFERAWRAFSTCHRHSGQVEAGVSAANMLLKMGRHFDAIEAYETLLETEETLDDQIQQVTSG